MEQTQTDYTRAADVLDRTKTQVKKLWEKRVRREISAASGMTTPVLMNSLEIFLDELVVILSKENPLDAVKSGEGMTLVHASQRATLEGYYLQQLLKEYSLLREIISEVLDHQGALDFEVRRLVDRVIDSVISTAATKFTEIQQNSMKEALKKAEMSNKELEHFASIAAHDLKSPLATIMGYLHLVESEAEGKLESQSEEYLRTMQRTASRMRDLVDRLLDYARLTRSDREFDLIDMNEVVKASMQNLEESVRTNRAEIHYRGLPQLQGDFNLLVQLFQNLLANSLKFRRNEDPRIHIACKDAGSEWLFSVEDNGVGFDSSGDEDVFVLYKKLQGKYQDQGAGIGLATCRKVVELHNGKIWAESQPGVGTTFCFTLAKRS